MCPSPSIGPTAAALASPAKVKVLNPVSGRRTFITLRNAERYVSRGRARWHGNTAIAFIEDSHDRAAAHRSVVLASQLAYDRIGTMTFRQLAGIPVLGDVTKLFTRC
jgi:hypothetical protein